MQIKIRHDPSPKQAGRDQSSSQWRPGISTPRQTDYRLVKDLDGVCLARARVGRTPQIVRTRQRSPQPCRTLWATTEAWSITRLGCDIKTWPARRETLRPMPPAQEVLLDLRQQVQTPAILPQLPLWVSMARGQHRCSAISCYWTASTRRRTKRGRTIYLLPREDQQDCLRQREGAGRHLLAREGQLLPLQHTRARPLPLVVSTPSDDGGPPGPGASCLPRSDPVHCRSIPPMTSVFTGRIPLDWGRASR